MESLSHEVVSNHVATFVWIVCPIVMVLLSLYNARRKPPIEAEFATNERLNEVERRLEDKIEAMSNDNFTRNENVFRRINTLQSELQKQISAQPEKIIGLLKTTGVIK